MWFGQTSLNVNRFETGLSASVNRAYDKFVLAFKLIYGNVDIHGYSIKDRATTSCIETVF